MMYYLALSERNTKMYVNNVISNFIITGNAIGFYVLATYLEACNKAYKEFLGPKKFLS